MPLVVLFNNSRYLSPVHLHVFLQVAGLTEPSSTSCADVWPLSCVQSAVHNHLVPSCEGFPTKFTAVWPRVSVDSLVFSQQIPSLKVLGAECTLEGPLVSVNTPDMEEELPLPRVA